MNPLLRQMIESAERDPSRRMNLIYVLAREMQMYAELAAAKQMDLPKISLYNR